jgi:hypothetical protein
MSKRENTIEVLASIKAHLSSLLFLPRDRSEGLVDRAGRPPVEEDT